MKVIRVNECADSNKIDAIIDGLTSLLFTQSEYLQAKLLAVLNVLMLSNCHRFVVNTARPISDNQLLAR